LTLGQDNPNIPNQPPMIAYSLATQLMNVSNIVGQMQEIANNFCFLK